jgi:hypothetical protein
LGSPANASAVGFGSALIVRLRPAVEAVMTSGLSVRRVQWLNRRHHNRPASERQGQHKVLPALNPES